MTSVTPETSTVEKPAPLKFKVFNGGEAHMGFGVNSTIIYGEREALVIDTQFTLSNAHRLVADILETGCDLTYIYITHFHPDHFLGLCVVHDAFPTANVVSLPEIAQSVNDAFDFKIRYWGNEVLGVNGAKKSVHVNPLQEPLMLIDGQKVEVIGPLRGDSDLQSVVWVPSIRTLVAADTVFANAHVWVADDKTPEMRQEWFDVLDQLEALAPLVVVPGHAPSADFTSPDAIGFTREYLIAFVEELKKSDDSTQIMAAMERRYPGLATHICLEYSAKILRDEYQWAGEWPQALRDLKPIF
ncbi:MBL fold metallo-hydrolase [Pseudomonas sp. A34-9]|uniref:MBL fold metallo-hydrolase n=1 Tax=Pseudomonas sp. A34-9 TaxID=3034675 RepID=UPI00240D5DFF|nr:MBL fold metallo-hydrolase [Pseudomonas sp. A34-9]